jgi:catechol 2,3-dioxygenase-like lactoylglutathione lyase family enzyme
MNPTDDIGGIFVAMLPVTDLARTAAWYRDLLGMTYAREFLNDDGIVTGCAIAAPDAGYLIAFRLRSTTAGAPDLRGEHPVILSVPSREALSRIESHAALLGCDPKSGEHGDAAWVEVVDPDGICLRFAYPTNNSTQFTGVHFHRDGRTTFYDTPKLSQLADAGQPESRR